MLRGHETSDTLYNFNAVMNFFHYNEKQRQLKRERHISESRIRRT